MRLSLAFLAASILMVCSCNNSAYKVSDEGILLKLKRTDLQPASLLRVQVISKDIFRVTSTPSKKFSERQSLSVLKPDSVFKAWKAVKKGDTLEISTSSVVAFVPLQTGRIIFRDTDGRTLLSETDGGRTFSDTVVDNFSGYTMRQVFESPQDEAIYGLGQHQSNEINYKGKNESLFQYNTKVSVPFFVSTANYGILWDNYSLTRYGDHHDFSQLSLFRQFDADGREGGLTATYYENADTGRIFLKRSENRINYENLETVKDFPRDFPFYGSLITWEGQIEAPVTGTFHFGLYYAGYTRLWIDGKMMADNWRTAWNPNLAKFDLEMKRGEKHTLKLEWKPDGGVSYIGLRVLPPAKPEEQNKTSIWSELGEQIDYYFIRGNTMDDIISGYRALTGKAQVMPKWAMGFWQSRERYKTQEELLSTLREFRKRHIPIDNIVLDWFYWKENDWGSHEFDSTRFPDPGGLMDEVHKLNARLMISVWPKFYPSTEHYREMDKIGAMYHQAINDSIRDWVGKGYIG